MDYASVALPVSLSIKFYISQPLCLCFNSHRVSALSFSTYYISPDVIKLFSCSTKLSTKFILLINVKMPTTVGIFSFISMINTTFERLKARKIFICQHFSFYEQLKFRAQLS